MHPAVVFLAVRVVSVGPVDGRTLLAHDFDVMRVKDAYDRVVPWRERIADVEPGRRSLVLAARRRPDPRPSPSVVFGVHRLHGVAAKDVEIGGIAARQKHGAGLQKKPDAGAKAQPADMVRPGRHLDRSAAAEEAVVYGALKLAPGFVRSVHVP